MALQKKRWTPENWASLVPFGIGAQRPNNYMEVIRAPTENPDGLGSAWRILSPGGRAGAAGGTGGPRGWTPAGAEPATTR